MLLAIRDCCNIDGFVDKYSDRFGAAFCNCQCFMRALDEFFLERHALPFRWSQPLDSRKTVVTARYGI